MHKLAKYLDLTVSLLLIVAMGVLMSLLSPYMMGFKEQISIFLWDADRISWYFSNPAVLAAVTGDWITQFYYDNGAAIAITVALLIILWLGMIRLLRMAGAHKECRITAMLPVIIAGSYMIWPNYPVSGLIGLILSVWAACGVSAVNDLRIRTICIGLGTPLLFFLAGGHCITFALACLLVRRENLKAGLAGALAGMVIMLIMARLYNMTLLQASLYPVVPDYILPSTPVLMLLPLSVVACLVLTMLRNEVIPAVICGCCSIVVLSTSFYNDVLELSIKVGTLAYRSQWDKVRMVASENLDTQYGLFYWNLSYAREGRLPEAMLEYDNNSVSDGLFLSTTLKDSYLSMFYFTDALLEMGDVSQATDCALFGQTVLPGHYSSRMLRRLAEISVVTGDYPVAAKYLSILSRCRNHRKWAAGMMACIEKDSIPSELQVWRSRTSGRDRFFNIGDVRSSLLAISTDNGTNRVAVDYLMCSCILENDLSNFRILYERFWHGGLDRYYEVPDLYKQALYFMTESENSSRYATDRFNLNEGVN